MFFPLILIYCKEKSKTIFILILGVHSVIMLVTIFRKMQNKKVSKKIKSSYLVIAIFSKKHSNSKETEMRDSSTWDPD